MKTALIVDDEAPARNLMADLLREHADVDIIGMVANVSEAKQFVSARRPDLVFLDVDMPGGSGFDLVPALDRQTHLVFVTAYERHALEAFSAGATDYLVKPVAPSRLAITLDRTRQFPPKTGVMPAATMAPKPAVNQAGSLSLAGAAGRMDLIETGKILWIEAEQNYSRIHRRDEPRSTIAHKTLCAWEESLAQKGFARVSRSVLIQTEKIKHLTWKGRDETFVHFNDSEKVLNLGRAGASRLKALLNH